MKPTMLPDRDADDTEQDELNDGDRDDEPLLSRRGSSSARPYPCGGARSVVADIATRRPRSAAVLMTAVSDRKRFARSVRCGVGALAAFLLALRSRSESGSSSAIGLVVFRHRVFGTGNQQRIAYAAAFPDQARCIRDPGCSSAGSAPATRSRSTGRVGRSPPP